jgi:hypothetical protein
MAKRNPVAKKIAEEIRVYTRRRPSNGVDENIRELYAELKSVILTLGGDIEVRPKKLYVAFRRNKVL